MKHTDAGHTQRHRLYMRITGLHSMLLSAVFLLVSVSSAHAGGFDTKGLGSRALGMGGAAIGLADDWSAIYWNPAGLAFLNGSGVFLEFQTLFSQQRSSISVRNISGGLPDFLAGDFVKFEATRDVEPDRFTNKSLSAFIPTPDLGWYHNFGRFTLASGLYATSGGGVAWEDQLSGFNDAAPGDRIDGSIKLGFFSLNIPIALAVKVTDNIAVGANLSGVIGYNSREVIKTYTYQDVSKAPLRFENSSTSFALGMGLDLGVKAKVTEELHVGGVLRLPYTVKGEGNSKFEIPEEVCEAGNCEWGQYVEEDENRVETEQPLRWGIGLAYLPTTRLKLDVDLYWVAHSKFITKSFYDSPDDSRKYLDDSNPEWGFNDTYMVRFGTEYMLSDVSAVRTGFIYDPSPFKDERASLTSPRFTDGYIFTAGYGHRFNAWQVDFAYQLQYSPERVATVSTPNPNGGSMPERVAITGQGHIATVTVGYLY